MKTKRILALALCLLMCLSLLPGSTLAEEDGLLSGMTDMGYDESGAHVYVSPEGGILRIVGAPAEADAAAWTLGEDGVFVSVPVSAPAAADAASGAKGGGSLAGEGTEEDPYQITDYADLLAFAALVNGGDYFACAVIQAEGGVIDASASDPTNAAYSDALAWTPIGLDSGTCYCSHFDGRGCVITGLTCNNDQNRFAGLFGYVSSGAVVENLGLAGGSISGGERVGGIAGENYGTVTNCYNAGDVSGSTDYCGGIVGANHGTVTNCYNAGDVSGGTDYCGGIVGVNHGTVTNCYNTGSVS